jgi:uncharacterized protein YqiB (DUF1249 family)
LFLTYSRRKKVLVIWERRKKEEGFSYLGEKEEAIKAKMSAINNVLIVLAVAENSKFKTKIRLTQSNRVSSQNARFDR